jgi:hypothetical protein
LAPGPWYSVDNRDAAALHHFGQQQQQQQQLPPLQHHVVNAFDHHLAPVHGGPMMHSSLTECAGCRVLTLQLEREQARNTKVMMEWQRSTNELSGLQARLEERVKAVAESKETAKTFEARYLEQQKHANVLQAQLVEISAEERRLRLVVADLEARNHALLVGVRSELGALAVVAETIGKQVEDGIANDQLIAKALESDQRRAEAREVDDMHDIDGILNNSVPARRNQQQQEQQEQQRRAQQLQQVPQQAPQQTPQHNQRRATLVQQQQQQPDEEMTSTNDLSASRKRAATSQGVTADEVNKNADDLPVTTTSLETPVTNVKRRRAGDIEEDDDDNNNNSRDERAAPVSNKLPTSAPRVIDRSRGRSVTFEDDHRRHRERAMSMGPPSRRGVPSDVVSSVVPSQRREWQEFRAWAASMVTPELVAEQAAKLATWKQVQGLVPQRARVPGTASLLQARVRAPLVPIMKKIAT